MKRNFVWVLLIACIAVWALPSMLRPESVPFPGYDPYDDAHLASLWKDELIVVDHQADGAIRLLTPLNIILAMSGGSLSTLRLLGLVAGLCGAIGLWLIVSRLSLPLRTSFLALALFALSPLTMYLFSVPTSLSWMVGLSTLAVGLMLQRHMVWRVLAVMIGMTVAICGPMPALHVAIMLALALLWHKQRLAALLVSCGVIAAGAAVWWSLTGQLLSQFKFAPFIVGVIAEFGVHPGIGVMAWLIAMIGVGVMWNKGEKPWALACVIAVLYGCTSQSAVAFLAPMWSILCAMAILHLADSVWRFPSLQTLSLFAIGCGLLLSILAAGTSIVNAPPTTGLVDGISTLGKERVLTYPDAADWVKWWSPADVVYDSHILDRAAVMQRDATLGVVWYDRDLKNVTRVLDSLGVQTVVVTRAMRNGQVWSYEEEGMLFILENSEMFKKGFSSDEVQVYRRTKVE